MTGTGRPPRLAAGRARAMGVPTRGTTNPNRLRRVDRWLSGTQANRLRDAADPLVVDLGFGGSPVTTVEMYSRLRLIRPDVRVVGLEVDPARVAVALDAARPPGLTFGRGGFELAGYVPVVVRAMNVLRQYDEAAVAGAWATMLGQLAPGGVLVEGTCDETGRRGCWFAVEAVPAASGRPAARGSAARGSASGRSAAARNAAGGGSQVVRGSTTLTLAARLSGLDRPSELAERLPKSLIARNVPGEDVHALLAAFDRGWDAAAGLAPFGPRQRWSAAVATLRAEGWPVLHDRRRWRLGEVTVRWPPVRASRALA